ncbi:hypothetical protein PGPR2_30325 [Pseudomonas aeruginosa PGPR2]|nr:hypothetical protein PGPR2_30325 [Pseudomonas aeruginosa PGPR2]
MSSPSLVELKAILRLAGPLIAAQLAYVAMVFTDTVMMGKLGPDALAAGGLGAVSYAFVSTFCVGVVAAVGNLVATRHPARRHRTAPPRPRAPDTRPAPRWPWPPACCYGTCGRCSWSSARRRRRWTAPCSSSTA